MKSKSAFQSRSLSFIASALLLAAAVIAPLLTATRANDANNYVRRNLISNRHDPSDKETPPNAPIIDDLLLNPWGAAIRTAGLGGHFWLANAGSKTVTEYVGDVFDMSGKFIPLFQDNLKVVEVDGSPIGQVFVDTYRDFPVRGSLCGDDGAKKCDPSEKSYLGEFTGPAKFIVNTEEGQIAAWSEGFANGKFGRMRKFENVVDNAAEGALYRGLAVTGDRFGNLLYAANFNAERIEVYDSQWRRVPDRFGALGYFQPFARPAGVPDGYRPFNVQVLGNLVFVTWAELVRPGDKDFDPEDPIAERACEGCGYVSAYTPLGQLVATLEGKGKLNAPWGLAIAPKGFGPFEGKLLVGNFGDGRIVAFDPTTGKQLDYLRDAKGEPIELEGLWAIFSGNGASLGRSDYLYWTAGYNDEEDGGFGTLHWASNPKPSLQ
jgi:uncharacterized protein (TIGR03118 family)